MLYSSSSGMAMVQMAVVADGPLGWFPGLYHQPALPPFATTLCLQMLAGVGVQKPAASRSDCRRVYSGCTLMARLASKTFSRSPPSSTKKLWPFTSLATLFHTTTYSTPCVVTARWNDWWMELDLAYDRCASPAMWKWMQ